MTTRDDDANHPEWAPRSMVAEIVSRRKFPVAARSIERWPLLRKYVNRKVHHKVQEALEYADRLLAEAPATRQSTAPPPPRPRSAGKSVNP